MQAMIFEEKSFSSLDGIKIYCRIKETGAKRWLIVTHGLGEHGGRHSYLFEILSNHFNICLYDLRGHGKSGGARGDINDFSDYRQDLKLVLEFLREEYRLDEYVLLGHSMGGLIVADFIQSKIFGSHYPQKVFLSSPAVSPGNLLGLCLQKTPRFLMKSLSRAPFSAPLGGTLDIRNISHDARVIEDYKSDPLNILKPQSRLLLSIIDASQEVFSRPLECSVPLYCSVGTGDKIVSYPKIKQYFTKVESCHLHEIQDCYHEPHNEIERYRSDFIQFLKSSLI